jgi:hypothetical protein
VLIRIGPVHRRRSGGHAAASRTRRGIVVTLVAGGVLAFGAAAAPAEPVFTVRAPAGGGPKQYDRVPVQRFGRPAARTVLVLTPGKYSGAGEFTLVARDLVARVPSVQIWAVDRREQGFEDNTVMAAGDPGRALEYYLHGAFVDGRTFTPPAAAEVGYMGRWGLARVVDDLHAVVRRAHASGRRVVLGGYSLGASVAEAYAVWDFRGRAGARDLAGLVLIDGGLLQGVDLPSVAEARARAREFLTAPRDDPFGRKMPWSYGVLTGVAGLLARNAPQAPSPLNADPAVPAYLTTPFTPTNATFLGAAASRLYPAVGPAAAYAGHPADAGDPRPWVDGALTPAARLAVWAAQSPVDIIDWYTPQRLVNLDVVAADRLVPSRLTRALGLRLAHLRHLSLPLYAFQTSVVPELGRRLVNASRIRHPRLVADPRMTHIDPLVAVPEQNTFLHTVVHFLRRLSR